MKIYCLSYCCCFWGKPKPVELGCYSLLSFPFFTLTSKCFHLVNGVQQVKCLPCQWPTKFNPWLLERLCQKWFLSVKLGVVTEHCRVRSQSKTEQNKNFFHLWCPVCISGIAKVVIIPVTILTILEVFRIHLLKEDWSELAVLKGFLIIAILIIKNSPEINWYNLLYDPPPQEFWIPLSYIVKVSM